MTSSNPLATEDTLIIPPSFSVSAEPPALSAIPGSAATALAVLVDQASAITAEELNVADTLRFPLSSFIDDDDEIDVDLEDFFAPKPKSKGKGKAAPPPPPPPPPPKKAAATAPDAAAPVAGPSTHPFLSTIQFIPVDKIATRFTTQIQQSGQRNVEALAVGETMLYDKLERVQRNLVDGLEGVNAQLIAIAADGAAAEASNPVSPMNFNSLIAVSNQHTANSTAINGALESVLARIRVLEQDVGLPATVGALANAVQVLMARVDRISGPTSADPIAGNVNGKRARDDDVNDEGPAKRQHFAPTIAAPPMLAFPPAAPAYVPPTHHGAPAYIPPTPQAPSAYVPPAHHSAAYAARAPASVAAALPRAPGTAALPRAPAAGPPRARIDPAREVLFGPIDWEKNWNHSPRVLISSVPNLNMKGARYTSRRGPDDTFVILVFEADTVADWFVKAWNENPRIAYELCFASKNV